MNSNQPSHKLSLTHQTNRRVSVPMLHGGSKFRQGVLQLMIHSVDPLHQEIMQAQQQQPGAGASNGSRPDSSAGKGMQQHTHPPGSTECPMCDGDGEGTYNSRDESNNNPSDANKNYNAVTAAATLPMAQVC